MMMLAFLEQEHTKIVDLDRKLLILGKSEGVRTYWPEHRTDNLEIVRTVHRNGNVTTLYENDEKGRFIMQNQTCIRESKAVESNSEIYLQSLLQDVKNYSDYRK